MTIAQANVPWQRGYDYGIGVDLVSGNAMGLVVNGESPTGVVDAHGSKTLFFVERFQTTSDLERSLGIDVSASYGSAAFGAGVDARLDFVRQSKVQTSSLFMSVVATVELEFKQIKDPVMVPHSAKLVDSPAAFAARYGNVFVRGVSRGGFFVGVIRVDTESSEASEKIAASLKGTYGLFSAEADVKFQQVQKDFHASTFCTMYSEGGPTHLVISDPSDPRQILASVNNFLEAFEKRPDDNARPYQVTFAPISIAEGPLPPNDAEIEHAEDVLRFCAIRRSTLLDQLNLLQFFLDNASKFDFSNGANAAVMRQAAGDTQSDLDLVSACASAALNHPGSAMMPADFAEKQIPSMHFPKAVMPSLLPTLKSLASQIKIESFEGKWESTDNSRFERLTIFGAHDNTATAQMNFDREGHELFRQLSSEGHIDPKEKALVLTVTYSQFFGHKVHVTNKIYTLKAQDPPDTLMATIRYDGDVTVEAARFHKVP